MAVSFELPRRIEREYQTAIHRAILDSIPSPDPSMSFDEWLANLETISHARDLAEMASVLAGRMVGWVNIENARTWRQAAAKSTKARMLYTLLEREMQGPIGRRIFGLTQENARLIMSIPSDVAGHLTDEIREAQQQGSRPETIAKALRLRFPELVRWKTTLLARTETSKASTALTQARSEELDLPAYEWITSHDARVRPAHRKMDGVIVFWDDPPSPEALIGIRSTLGHYHSGNCPNCRCSQRVILSIKDVSWPHRVYRDGSILMMRRAEFEKRFANQLQSIAA